MLSGLLGISLRMRICLRCQKRVLHTYTPNFTRLIEVGRLEDPKLYDDYTPGQLFLHRVFGYRGVVLFHWSARLYDRDMQEPKISRCQWEEEGEISERIKELKPERQTYYQVLIDQRDFHQIKAPPEGITMTADRDDDSLYSISGLDYVNHEDILPYVATVGEPSIHHDLYSQFFTQSEENETSQHLTNELLSSWHQKNIRWLEQVEVHRETTKNIRVTVVPFYMGHREIQKSFLHWWRYSIRLENTSGSRIQLRQRHWRIFSSSGTLETVRGDGVIGQQPVLSIRQPAFQYSSHVSLQAPKGHMWGTFRMEREDGKFFDVRIPPFNLQSHEYPSIG